MSTNFTGLPTTAESPSPAPSPGVAPIVSLPDDGDALNVASVNQIHRALANNVAALQLAAPYASSVAFYDDFLGTNLSTYQWLAPANVNATVSIDDDSANGGFGSLHTVAAASGSYHSYITQRPIAEMDAAPVIFWRIAYRIRCHTFSTWGNSSFVSFGFENAIGPEIVIACTGPGGARPTWYVSENGSTGPTHNTTVAPISTAYQTIVATCLDTQLTVTIDGTVRYSNAAYTSPTIATPTLRANGSGTTDAVMFMDSVSYNIGRHA